MGNFFSLRMRAGIFTVPWVTVIFFVSFSIFFSSVFAATPFIDEVESGPVQSDTVQIDISGANITSAKWNYSVDGTCNSSDFAGGETVFDTISATNAMVTFSVTNISHNGAWICGEIIDDATTTYYTSENPLNVDITSPSAPSNLNLDDTDDTGKSNTDNLTKNTSALTITGSAEADSSVKIYDTDGTTLLGTSTATGGNFSINVSLTKGVHSLTAKATDFAGNISIASSSLVITVDTTAPIFVSAQTKTTTTVDVTFSETLDNASKVDFGIGANTSQNNLANGGSGFTTNKITFVLASPIGTGETPVVYYNSMWSSGVQDEAGNTMLTAQITPTDGVKPVLVNVTPIITPTNNNTPNYTFSVTEEGTVTYAGGCSSVTTALAGDNTITLNVLADGTYSACTIIVTDSATNVSTALTIPSFTIDTQAPNITITNPTTTKAQSKTVTASVNNGTLEMIVDSSTCDSGTTGTFVGYASTTFSAEADNGKKICYRATDTAGNISYSFSNAIAGIDTVAPTISSIVLVDSALKANEASLVTITFSEAVTAFDNSDLTIANGTLSAISSSDGGTTWTGEFTPNANIEDETNIISLNAAGITDIAGNAGIGTTDSANYVIDTKYASISAVSVSSNNTNTSWAKAGNTVTYAITYSENATVFVTSPSIANNATTLITDVHASNATSDTLVFTVATGDTGLITPNTIAFTITDTAGNVTNISSLGAITGTVTADTTAPTVTITDDEAATANIENGNVVFTFTFSEAVTGFDASDIVVTGGTKGAFTATSATVYTLAVTPETNSTANITIDVPAGVAQDTASNASIVSTQAVQTVDTLSPTATFVSISSDNTRPSFAKQGNEITISFTTSETVGTPTVTIAGKNATVANVSGNQYTAKYTITATETQGLANIVIHFTDIAGNVAIPVVATTNASAVMIDTIAMTIAETTASPTPTANATPSIVITPTEDGTFVITGTGCTLYSSVTNTLVANTQKIITFGPLPYGTYNCSIVATDFPGNVTTKALTEFIISTTSATSSSSGGGGGGSYNYTSLSAVNPSATNSSSSSITQNAIIETNPSFVIVDGKTVDLSTLTPKERREIFYPILTTSEATPSSTNGEEKTPVSAIFVDTQKHWAKDIIEMLGERGIVKEAEEFRPNDPITRAEVVKMAVEAFEIKKDLSGTTVFQDVPQEEWYAEYVISAKNSGIISEKSTFEPNKTIIRAEALKIVLLAANVPLKSGDSGFLDVKAEDWYADYVFTARISGIVNGKGDGFAPNDPITRSEFAKILFLLLK